MSGMHTEINSDHEVAKQYLSLKTTACTKLFKVIAFQLDTGPVTAAVLQALA
jgi:hypothetical protein